MRGPIAPQEAGGGREPSRVLMFEESATPNGLMATFTATLERLM